MQVTMEFARVTATPDETGPVGLVQVACDDARIYDQTPNMQQFGFASALPDGAMTIRMFAGDATKGVLVASVHQDSRPRNLQPGQSMLYDQAGNGMRAGNNGVVTTTAAAAHSVAAPSLRVDGNLRSANGANGVFSSPAGQMAVIRGGRVEVITMPDGSGAVTNPTALQKLLAEINACGDCTFLNKLGQEIAGEEQALIQHFIGQITALNDWVALLTPPEPTPQAILDYLKKVIKVVFGSQFNAQITAIQQLSEFVQEIAEVPAAIASAAGRIGECVASFTATVTPSIPALPVAPPGTFS